MSKHLLSKLNSGSFTPKSYKDLKGSILLASMLPFDESFVVYEFIIKNFIVKSKNSKESITYFADISNSLISTLKLVNLIEIFEFEGVYIEQEIEKTSNFTIKLGDRDRFYQILIHWFQRHEPQEIILIDPYFEPKGVELLKLIKIHLPGSTTRVLTSFTKLGDDINDLQDRFQSA